MLAMHYAYARVGMRKHMADIPAENTVVIFKVRTLYICWNDTISSGQRMNSC